MRYLAILAVAVLGTAVSVPARADLFDFYYTGPGFTASGTFTATLLSDNIYQITAISGVRDGQAITGLIRVNGYYTNTNLLYYPAGGSNPDGSGFLRNVDSGVAFSVGTDRYVVGLRGSGPSYDEVWAHADGSTFSDTLTTFEVAANPMPLPGAGLLSYLVAMCGAGLRWRKIMMERLRSWRRELFGEKALALKHGRLALAVERGKVVAFDKSDT